MGAPVTDLYSPSEIARAASVPEEAVLEYLSGPAAGPDVASLPGPLYLSRSEAVRIGAALVVRRRAAPTRAPDSLFSVFSPAAHDLRSPRVFALSSTIHGMLFAVVAIIATFNLVPRAATLSPPDQPADLMRLIFLATPGPGGGGGGGGLQQPAPPPKAMREGQQKVSSPVPEVKPIAPAPAPSEPLRAEQLPTVIAPIVSSPSGEKNRVGLLEETAAENETNGPGSGGGVGTGRGAGLGPGSGAGVGAGSGGGTGGGPYRPGSGIDPPRLLREVKADYTEDARRRGLAGEVVLEIVVQLDGSVGDVKILRGLDAGLNDRAVQAVRQWRFAPAQRQGQPVDVLVEVAVEFKLR